MNRLRDMSPSVDRVKALAGTIGAGAAMAFGAFALAARKPEEASAERVPALAAQAADLDQDARSFLHQAGVALIIVARGERTEHGPAGYKDTYGPPDSRFAYGTHAITWKNPGDNNGNATNILVETAAKGDRKHTPDLSRILNFAVDVKPRDPARRLYHVNAAREGNSIFADANAGTAAHPDKVNIAVNANTLSPRTLKSLKVVTTLAAAKVEAG